MLKRIICLVMCFLIFSSLYVSAAEKDVSLVLNGKNVKTDVPPVIINSRTLIPVRALFENINAKVEWNDKEKTVTINYSTKKIVLKIDSTTATINGVNKNLDVAATIIDDRTMIPVRFVSENLGFVVGWDDATKTVSVTTGSVNTNKLTDVKVTDEEKGSYVTLKGLGGLTPKVSKLTSPNRLIMDFASTTMLSNTSSAVSKNDYFSKVRVAQFNTVTTRVVFDMDEFSDYEIKTSKDDLIISFGKTSLGGIYEFSTLSSKAKGKLVIIDAGHGGVDVGTIGNYEDEEVYEKDINIFIADKLNAFLKSCGVSTYMIRSGDAAVDILERPQIANEKGGYLYLSVHCNASENPETNGVQIYYSESCAKFDNMTNEELSKVYYENIAELGLKKAGMVDNPRYIVIYKSEMPSIIIENAFVSNESDLELLMDDNFKTDLAAAICESTITVLNESVE